MLAILSNNYVKYSLVGLALVFGLGIKLYLGSANPIAEEADHVIDEVALAETGVNLTPFLEPGVNQAS